MSTTPDKDFQVLVLDGGFGTTLETLFSQDISGPLWSARLIDHDPEIVIKAHEAFLASGSDIILTSTYQCSYSTFSRAGYTREDADRIMQKAVRLAVEAKERYLTNSESRDQPKRQGEPKIALSLGSFGATLPGGEEFGGNYPPPFGPPGKVNTFSEDESTLEEDSIRALEEFYLERLRVFLPVWDAVDYVGFETVPLRREIVAIRRAMEIFLGELPRAAGEQQGEVKWWVSTVWPDGVYPEVNQNGEHNTTTADVVTTLLEEREREARPWGVGINCTALEYVPRIVKEMEDALSSRKGDATPSRPWLVVYPNGGDTYDGATQTWITNHEAKGESWVRKLWDVVEGVQGLWSGMVIGGCCRTGPDEIDGIVAHKSTRAK